MSGPQNLLTVAEVCRITSLGRTKIYEELLAQRLRSVKVGSRRLVPSGSLDEWIESLPAGFGQ